MLTANNPAVGLAARRQIYSLVAEGDLDEPTASLLERALDKSRKRGPSGWTFLLAEALGAEREAALAAGVYVEFAGAVIDVTDDVEDGDADAYLTGVPRSIQVNVCVHLTALAGALAIRLARSLGESSEFAERQMLLLSRVGCGQRLELARENWCTDSYERMAKLSGGCQFEMYLRAAACAARAGPEPLVPIAAPLGVLVSMAADRASSDPRLMQLAAAETDRVAECNLALLEAAVDASPTEARGVLARLVEFARHAVRCDAHEETQ